MIEYATKAWIDGEYKNFSEITIPIQTYGLHYGASVYEGIRIYNGKGFKLKEHMQRLIESAKALKMKLDFSLDDLCEATKYLLEVNVLKEGYIRPIVWRGAGDLLISSFNKPSIAIIMWGRMSPFIENIKDKKAQKLTIAKYTRYNPESYPAGAKIGGLYVSNSLSKYIASEEGYDDAIMLTSDGKVAEATTSNIFVVKKGILYTPTTKNILNGITRQLVIELAKENNIEIKEQDFELDFFKDADEVFLTGTACEITPVLEINEIKYTPGNITEKLYNAFINLIRAY